MFMQVNIRPIHSLQPLAIKPTIAFHETLVAELSHSKKRLYPGRSRLRRLTRLTQISAFKNNKRSRNDEDVTAEEISGDQQTSDHGGNVGGGDRCGAARARAGRCHREG